MSDDLILHDVHTHIGRYHILQGVDFAAPQGETTMLLGRNGAGKTTALRTIMGLWRASRGAITLGGAPLAALHTSAIARAGVAYVPETMAVFSDLSVRDNLVLGARDGPLDDRGSNGSSASSRPCGNSGCRARARCRAARSRCCRSRARSSSRAGCC